MKKNSLFIFVLLFIIISILAYLSYIYYGRSSQSLKIVEGFPKDLRRKIADLPSVLRNKYKDISITYSPTGDNKAVMLFKWTKPGTYQFNFDDFGITGRDDRFGYCIVGGGGLGGPSRDQPTHANKGGNGGFGGYIKAGYLFKPSSGENHTFENIDNAFIYCKQECNAFSKTWGGNPRPDVTITVGNGGFSYYRNGKKKPWPKKGYYKRLVVVGKGEASKISYKDTETVEKVADGGDMGWDGEGKNYPNFGTRSKYNNHGQMTNTQDENNRSIGKGSTMILNGITIHDKPIACGGGAGLKSDENGTTSDSPGSGGGGGKNICNKITNTNKCHRLYGSNGKPGMVCIWTHVVLHEYSNNNTKYYGGNYNKCSFN